MNNFILKLRGHLAAGFTDCAIRAPVLAFDPSNRDWIAVPGHEGTGRNPTCVRVG